MSDEDSISIEADFPIGEYEYEQSLMDEFCAGKSLSELPSGFEKILRNEVQSMMMLIARTCNAIDMVAVSLEQAGSEMLDDLGAEEWETHYNTGIAHGRLGAAALVGLLLNQTQAGIMTLQADQNDSE